MDKPRSQLPVPSAPRDTCHIEGGRGTLPAPVLRSGDDAAHREAAEEDERPEKGPNRGLEDLCRHTQQEGQEGTSRGNKGRRDAAGKAGSTPPAVPADVPRSREEGAGAAHQELAGSPEHERAPAWPAALFSRQPCFPSPMPCRRSC